VGGARLSPYHVLDKYLPVLAFERGLRALSRRSAIHHPSLFNRLLAER